MRDLITLVEALMPDEELPMVGYRPGKAGGKIDARAVATKATETAVDPEFRKWFTGSVAKKGSTPILMFHGTPRVFDRFDSSQWLSNADGDDDEAGFYFTPNTRYAARYANGSNGRIIPAFLRITNPYRVTGRQWGEGQGLSPAEARAKGHDGMIVAPYDDGTMYIVWDEENIWEIGT